MPTYESIPHIPAPSHINLDGGSFAERIDKARNEIVKWRKNLVLVPDGNEGKELISELQSCS